jgi:NADPH:quinone reductase-like Zn-dependent oxidoreductase
MKAYQLKKLPDGLRPVVSELPLPEPGAGQVRVRLQTASLNYRDLLSLMDGGDHWNGCIPLSDGAGVIEAVGEGVDGWRTGDRVATSFFPHWVAGPYEMDYLATALGGQSTDGVLAEAALLPAHGVVAIPERLTAAQAATLPCAAVTAWQALVVRGGLTAQDTVLIQGTGGVAIFALQIANAIGAKSIVLSSSDEKLDRVAALGASHGINYRQVPDWHEAVRALTGGRGASHILELGGPGTFGRSLKSVAAGGHIAQIGVLTGFGPQENLISLQFANATIDGICVGSRKHLEEVIAFFEEHRIEPVIDRSFTFQEAPQAFDYLKGATHFGKVVIEF